MVGIRGVPGIQIEILGEGHRKREYICHERHFEQYFAAYVPRERRYIESTTGQKIVIRISISEEFPHLNDCTAIRFTTSIDGDILFTTRPRTEHVRTRLFRHFERVFTHIEENVRRKVDGQWMNKVPKFQPMELGEKNVATLLIFN